VTEVNVALGRAIEFHHRLQDRCARVRVPFEWGTFLSNPDLPLVWDLNYARLEPGELPEPATIVDAVRRLPWPAASRHRKIVVDDETVGRRLAPGFKALEWQVEPLVYMVLTGDPPPIPPIPVREISSEERGAALVDFLPQLGTKPDSLPQIIASRRVVEEAIEVRRFGTFVEGEAAAMCELFLEGGAAQIEDVATGVKFRKRGLANAIVLNAMHAALAAGAEFIFLVAEADDWPKEMYAKLGFEEVGLTYDFLVPPDDAA
jgi:ribosomal protein S18 acetylase RimI-like enzyme